MEQNQIKAARLAAGLTAKELADKIITRTGKVASKQYVQRLETMAPGTSAGKQRMAEIAAIIAKAEEVKQYSAYVWQK